jgi:hypothetical protein
LIKSTFIPAGYTVFVGYMRSTHKILVRQSSEENSATKGRERNKGMKNITQWAAS